jgi:hypothetical protein
LEPVIDSRYNSIKIYDCDRSESLPFHRYQYFSAFNRTGVNLLTASSKIFTLAVQNVAKDILIAALSLMAIRMLLQYITCIIYPGLDGW